MSQFMAQTRSSIRSLETQIGQLATLMANKAKGDLPSTTEVNPKENCKAITLRNGKNYEGPRADFKINRHRINQELQLRQKITSGKND